MKKILVITDKVPPFQSATGNIAYNLSKELSKYAKVYLVHFESGTIQKINNNFFMIPGLPYSRNEAILDTEGKQTFVSSIIRMLLHVWVKIMSVLQNKKKSIFKNERYFYIKKVAEALIKCCGIDIIMPFSCPFVTQEIAESLLNIKNSLLYYPVLFDSIRHNATFTVSIGKEKTILNKSKRIFACDFIKADEDFCTEYSSKLIYIKLPILTVPNKSIYGNLDANKTIFIYSGVFYEKIRNPEPLFSLFSKLPDNYILILYSAGCENIVRKYKEILGERLLINSHVDPRLIETLIQKANIFLNIGNTGSNQVPSKIYDCIGYGMPLLSFIQNDEDISLADQNRYPISKIVKYTDFSEEKISEIIEWVETNKNKRASIEQINKQFSDRKPENIVKNMVDALALNE